MNIAVNLGCEPWERAVPQPVLVRIVYHSEKILQSAQSDDLATAIDYATLGQIVARVAQEKQYHLVEHLLLQIKLALEDSIPQLEMQELIVKKCNPPIPWLGAVEFSWKRR